MCAFLAIAMMARTYAQDVIALQHSGSTKFYYGLPPYTQQWLQTVFNHAVTGDTVYLPGVEIFLQSNLQLSAGVVLIGTGIHPDSSTVYGANQTTLTSTGGQFYLFTGADYAQMHGIILNARLYFGNSAANQTVNHVRFNRCMLNDIVQMNATSSDVKCSQCVLALVYANGVSSLSVSGSIIYSMSNANGSAIFSNNVFVNVGNSANTNSLYRDNIFLLNTPYAYNMTEQSRFYNNLFILNGGSIVWAGGTQTNQNNRYTTQITDALTSPPTNNTFTTFDFHGDYSLNPQGSNFPTYNTMSTTGGPVGLFAGNPLAYWKNGAVPFNPHWQTLTVSPNTNSVNGYLNIKLKAAGQVY